MSGIDEYTALMLHMDGSEDGDSSIYEHTVVANGSPTWQETPAKWGNSIYFKASEHEYLSVSDHPVFAFGTQKFTIDFWVYGRPSTTGAFYAQYNNSDQSNRTAIKMYNTTTVMFYIISGGNYAFRIISDDGLPATQWNHIAVVRNGLTTNDWYLFINGHNGSPTIDYDPSSSVPNYDQGPTIGYFYHSVPQYMSSYMDELRVSVGIARWKKDFTPPINPYDEFVGPGNIFGKERAGAFTFGSKVDDVWYLGTDS
jgi:hypothetical protein